MNEEKKFIRKVRKYDKIVIYGAGRIGRLVLKSLTAHKLSSRIDCFCVTSLDNNRDYIDDFPVISIRDLNDVTPGTLVIIAMSEKFHDSIRNVLSEYDFKNILFVSKSLFFALANFYFPDTELKLYICHGYYHILIALMKILANKERADIILTNKVLYLDYSIGARLLKSKLVNNVIYVKKSLINEYRSTSKLVRKFIGRKRNIESMEKILMLDVTRYKGGIYIFFEDCCITRYLQAKKCKYHLLEDCYDFMKSVLPLKFSDYLNYLKSFEAKIDRFFDLDYQYFGQSKYCTSIEVNDKEGIAIPQNKVVELPRKQLIEQLTPEQKEKLSDIFSEDLDLDVNDASETALLITQPLFIDSFVSSLEIQIALYKEIILELQKNYKMVYVKPHPRDTYDYSSLVENIMIIEKTIPTEIFNFKGRILFDKAVTIHSTAIYTLDCVREKELLGIDYLNNFVEKFSHQDCI